MILVDGCLFFDHGEGNVEKVLKVEATLKSRRLCPNRGDVPKGTVSISSTNDLFPASNFKVKIISLHCI